MTSTRSLFSAAAVLIGSSAALLMGGIAKADPAPIPNPGVPAISAAQQVPTAPNGLAQMLQNAASALTGIPAPAAPAAPVAPPPLASAAITAPQPAAAGGVPATGPASLMPNAQLGLPAVPGLPNAPQQLSLPGDLISLLTGMAVPNLAPASAAAIPAAVVPGAVTAPASSAAGLASLFPVSALP